MKAIYRPYLANPCPENMPILSDLHQALLDQHLPEADRVAQALDLYVSGSLNVFNHKTNVDIHNRLVAFDIKELGKQLKNWGCSLSKTRYGAVLPRTAVRAAPHGILQTSSICS